MVDAMGPGFAPGGGAPQLRQLGVVGAGPQRSPQVGFDLVEQAGAKLAVSGQPGAVTGLAERRGDRGDDADVTGEPVPFDVPQLGRCGTAVDSRGARGRPTKPPQ